MNPGALLSTLFASKLRIALVAVAAVTVAVGGAFAVGVLGVPGVADIDNTFGDVTEETTVIETDLVISNPNPLGVSFDGVSVNYTVSMNSIEMAHGQRDGIGVESGNSTLDLETEMRNEAIPPWWTSHIRNDERTTIDIDATLASNRLGRSTDISRSHNIETDLIGAFNSEETRPVNANSPLTDDPILYINETRGEWGAVSDTETPIEMAFVVYNPNLEPYVVTEMGYDITMNGVEMGSGETHRGHVIGPDSTETIPLTTAIRNQNLDNWWVTHLDEETHGHQVSELRIEFYAVVELPTGNEVRIPLDELTYEETISTDMFDEGGDVGEPIDSDADTESSEETDDNEAEDGTDETDSDDGTVDEGTDDSDDDGDDADEDDDDNADEDDDILPV